MTSTIAAKISLEDLIIEGGRQNGTPYLIKCLQFRTEQEEKKILNELNYGEVLKNVSQGVLRVFGWCVSETSDAWIRIKQKRFWIISEQAQANLCDEILYRSGKKNGQIISSRQTIPPIPLYFTSEELTDIIEKLLGTLAAIQESGISHGKVELESIYISQSEGRGILLGDFQGCTTDKDGDFTIEEAKSKRFPDRECLEFYLNGDQQFQQRRSAILLDVYSFGIVLCQISILRVFQKFLEFEREKDAILTEIKLRYGQLLADIIGFMISDRVNRPDFVALRIFWRQFHPSPVNSGGQRTLESDIRSDLSSQIAQSGQVISSDNSRAIVTVSNSSGGSGSRSRSNNRSNSSENKSSNGRGNSNISSNKAQNDSIIDFHQLWSFKNIKFHAISEFRSGRALGTGQYGTVYEEGNYSVIKKYPFSSISQFNQFLTQIDGVIKYLKDIPHIVFPQMYSFILMPSSLQNIKLFHQQQHPMIQLSLISQRFHVSLAGYLQRTTPSLLFKLQILQKITQTLHLLHSLKPPLIHSNLKLQNILLDIHLTPFLSDGSYLLPQSSFPNIPQLQTPSYHSPEQLANQPLTPASDIHSLGYLFIELIFQKKISPNQIYMMYKKEKLDIGIAIYQLILQLVSIDPFQRPTTDYVIKQIDYIINNYIKPNSRGRSQEIVRNNLHLRQTQDKQQRAKSQQQKEVNGKQMNLRYRQ